jgi:hypothetical protein
MFGTRHHSAFDQWWEYAAKNYVTWDDGDPVGLDLYYDPIVDEHVAHGPIGIIAPTWYFAPQRPAVARAGWQTAAMVNGVIGDGPIQGLDEPPRATMLLQFAGEFADAETKARIWAAADEHVQPTWDRDAGEFTLGFELDEPHPRGQMNARAMAGWVCTPGAWARIFNEPNLTKFDEPTVEGVDFPRVALSEARWDGAALHLAAHPQNADNDGITTSLKITNVKSPEGWVMIQANGERVALAAKGDHVTVELVANNQPVVIRQA